jgi:assimilatory nitrate reductase catalytic subunit
VGKFARVALGTRHIDYNGRLCMVSAAAANKKAFGIDRAANPWSDMLETQVILIAGANVAECFPVMTNYVWAGRDRGAKIVVLDPRETPIARTADVFVPLRPGTDAAFLNGVLHVIERDGLLDDAFIAEHTVGWEAVRDVVRAHPPERVTEICGVDASLVERVGALWGNAERAMAFHARGVEHQALGVENALAVINLVLATGQLGAPGKGYGTITGQGNGQVGREHGQKADQLPGARDIENPEHRAFIADFWGISEGELPHAGVSAVELVHAFREGGVKGLLGICNNPLVSMPNVHRIVADYDALEFHVQLDFFLSETAERADVVLPSAVWAEDAGVSTNAEGPDRPSPQGGRSAGRGEARLVDNVRDRAASRPRRAVRIRVGRRDLRGAPRRHGRGDRRLLRRDLRASRGDGRPVLAGAVGGPSRDPQAVRGPQVLLP